VVTIEALLKVAGKVVVEADQENDPALAKAISSVGRERTLRIEHRSALDPRTDNASLSLPNNPSEWEMFGYDLLGLLAFAGARSDGGRTDRHVGREFEELLEQGQPRAAVLIGFVEIESTIDRIMRDVHPSERRRTSGFGKSLQFAQSLGWNADNDTVRRMTEARNGLVHGQATLIDQDLTWLAQVIGELLNFLDERAAQ
jgi:hypothetical protein